jgi:hypothetical protein
MIAIQLLLDQTPENWVEQWEKHGDCKQVNLALMARLGIQRATARSAGEAIKNLLGLPTAVKKREMWPTPTRTIGPKQSMKAIRDAQEKFRRGESKFNPGVTLEAAVEAGGQLNPMWVEWLMGWPLGWTDLRPLATDKFRQWCASHGAR